MTITPKFKIDDEVYFWFLDDLEDDEVNVSAEKICAINASITKSDGEISAHVTYVFYGAYSPCASEERTYATYESAMAAGKAYQARERVEAQRMTFVNADFEKPLAVDWSTRSLVDWTAVRQEAAKVRGPA